MTTTRRIVHIDEEKCNGCGECIPACHEGALQLIDGKARLVADVYCDGLGDCLGTCPQDAITVEEREAEEFDAAAVEARLAESETDAPAGCPGAAARALAADDPEAGPGCPGGACPGAALRKLFEDDGANGVECASSTGEKRDRQRSASPGFSPSDDDGAAAAAEGCPRGGERDGCGQCCGGAESEGPPPSRLGHWPLQLRLVPPGAPFLDGADIVVCADCVAYAVPDFHMRYVAGNAVLIGCPKLDDLSLYRDKLKKLFDRAQPASVTVLRMEVPCCAGIASAAVEACEEVLPGLPVEVHTIGIRGTISRTVLAGPGGGEQ